MRSSVLLALASGLLTHALPTDPKTSLNAVNARRPWTPVLPYPAGDSAATCPLGPGPDPYSTLEVPKKRSLTTDSYSTLEVPAPKKRSLTTATPLRRRNNLCKQIANGNVNNFSNPIGNTAETLLIAGATYVFSWAFDAYISQINAWRTNPDGTYTMFQSTGYNGGVGTMTLNIEQTANVHFELRFSGFTRYGDDFWSGLFALFQTANGNQNP